jgi:phage terminase large subunit-like protein
VLPEARHVVLPDGIVSSGYPRIRATLAQVGVFHDPWQVDLNRCLLGKRADGLYAADIAVLSIARQVGKTFNVGTVVFAECIANPKTTVVWTAHRFKVARETFDELKSLALAPLMAPHVDPDDITTAAGNECIRFRNGSRIVFAARERGAIRGFTKVRYLVLDEAQALTHAQLADLAATTNQATNPLIIVMGTPPKPEDPGEAFLNMRFEALHGETEDTLYVEFSADPDADVDDRAQWRTANPSYPQRTNERAIKRLRRILTRDDDFRREALGIWDSDEGYTVIRPDVWEALADRSAEPPRPVGQVAFAVHTAHDRSRTSISVVGKRPDGLPQVQLVERRDGVEWATARLVELKRAYSPYGVCVDVQSAAAGLVDDLKLAGIGVIEMQTQQVKQAFGDFYDAATETGQLRHLAQPVLTASLRSTPDRIVGDGRLWDSKAPDADAIISATLAYWGWSTRSRIGLQIF